MFRYYPLAFLILFSLDAFCQHFEIKGRVEHGVLSIEDAVILNSRSKSEANTNFTGEFRMDVAKGDSIIISKEGFFTAFKIIVSDAFLQIDMKPNVYQLKEVNVWALKNSPLKIYENNRREYKQIYQKGDMGNMFTITPVGIGLKIAPMYSALSKEGIDARRLQKIITKIYQNSEIDVKYNARLVNSITDLTGDHLEKFTEKYRPSLKWILAASAYDVQLYIKNKFASGG